MQIRNEYREVPIDGIVAPMVVAATAFDREILVAGEHEVTRRTI